MKLVGTIWGMIKLNQEYDLNLLAGMVAGNIFAGFNCYILYAIAQIKPKFSAPSIYSLAKEYRERVIRVMVGMIAPGQFFPL